MTKQLSTITLDKEVLKEDKKHCKHIGPCGVGEKALYLNSFYIDRCFSIPYESISRVFKRVAMSKGGFTGKGAFGSLPYLVVVYDGGKEKQCNFKYEEQVDQMVRLVHQKHPDIYDMSEAAAKRLEERRKELEARKLKVLTPEAERSIARLRHDQELLEDAPELTGELSQAARRKRAFTKNKAAYGYVALAITLMGVVAFLYGIATILGYTTASSSGFGIYFTLFGLAAIFLFAGVSVLPTAQNNKTAILNRDEKARSAMEAYIRNSGVKNFPVPARYAHPVVIIRMIRAIEEGRAITIPESLDAVKTELKALNSSVTVEKEEYDEIVAIKPMFLNFDYE